MREETGLQCVACGGKLHELRPPVEGDTTALEAQSLLGFVTGLHGMENTGNQYTKTRTLFDYITLCIMKLDFAPRSHDLNFNHTQLNTVRTERGF